MKKLMFGALACVAFAFSGFASNEVMKEEKVVKIDEVKSLDFEKEEFAVTPCNFTINIVDQNGNIIKTKKYTNVNPSPFKDCKEAGEFLAKKLNGVIKS